MSNLNTGVGVVFSVAVGAPSTYDYNGYEDLTWTEVGEVESVPEISGDTEIKKYSPLGSGRYVKRKGSTSYGVTTITTSHDLIDDGQEALRSGFDGANKNKTHSFRLHQSGVGATYLTGKIVGFDALIGGASDIRRREFAVRVTRLMAVEVE